MKNQKLFIMILLALLFFPLVSLAYLGTYELGFCDDKNKNERCDEGEDITNGTAIYDALVPCGGKNCVFETRFSKEDLKNLREKIEIKKREFIEEEQDPITAFKNACQENGGKWYPKEEERILSCELCHFFIMLNETTNFLLINIVFPIAVLLFVVGGALFIFAAGNPSMISQGWSVMTAVAIGLVIIFSSWIIVNTIFQFIGVKDVFKDWDTITCPIELPKLPEP